MTAFDRVVVGVWFVLAASSASVGNWSDAADAAMFGCAFWVIFRQSAEIAQMKAEARR